MVTNKQRSRCFLYLINNGIPPNVVNKEFNDWMLTNVMNKALFFARLPSCRLNRTDMLHLLFTCGVYKELSIEETPLAFVYACLENDQEIEDMIDDWGMLMMLYCSVYKKVDCIF